MTASKAEIEVRVKKINNIIIIGKDITEEMIKISDNDKLVSNIVKYGF